MANARIVLYGKDPFEFAKLSDRNLRHQTEYELRSKLIQLRRLYIPASTSIEKLCNLMSESLASFAALSGRVTAAWQSGASRKARVRSSRCQLLNLEMHPFERIFEFRASGALPSSEKETNEIFAPTWIKLSVFIEDVDKMDWGAQ